MLDKFENTIEIARLVCIGSLVNLGHFQLGRALGVHLFLFNTEVGLLICTTSVHSIETLTVFSNSVLQRTC